MVWSLSGTPYVADTFICHSAAAFTVGQYSWRVWVSPEHLAKSGDIFRVGVCPDFARLTTCAPHVGPQHERGAERNRIDRRSQIVLPLAGPPEELEDVTDEHRGRVDHDTKLAFSARVGAGARPFWRVCVLCAGLCVLRVLHPPHPTSSVYNTHAPASLTSRCPRLAAPSVSSALKCGPALRVMLCTCTSL